MGVGRCDRDQVIAKIAVGRSAGDDAGMGIDAEARWQLRREGQRIAGGGSGEMAGDIKRESLALIGALVCDRGGGRTVVADLEMKALANRFAVGIRGRHRGRVIAEVAVGRGARNDAGVCIDAKAGRQFGREGQGIADSGSREVAGDIKRESLALISALVCDGGCGRAAVADGKMEAFADRLAMGIGRGDHDRVVAEIVVGRGARDDAGLGIDAKARRQLGREGQRIAGGGGFEVAGDIEREGLAFISALVCDGGCRRAAVADLEVEALADRFSMRVGRRHRDLVVAEVAVRRGARDDAGVGIDAKARRQLCREG